MKLTRTLAFASLAALYSTGALAASTATTAAIKDIPNGEEVTVSGTVEDYDSRHPFTLRDASGTVKVDMTDSKPLVLKNGQKITVTGTVDKGIFVTDINATDITLDTTVGEKVGGVIDSITGQTPADTAQTVTVQSLPPSGLIKINGVVDTIGGQKKFTLRDSTGNVDVNVKSDLLATLRQGNNVTVVGYVDKSLIGKSINAVQVNLNSDTTATE